MPTNAEQTNERDELIEVVARTYPGWNEDTEDGDLTSHWEKVNAECRRQAAEIVDAILAAGWRPLFVQPLGEVQVAVEGDAGNSGRAGYGVDQCDGGWCCDREEFAVRVDDPEYWGYEIEPAETLQKARVSAGKRRGASVVRRTVSEWVPVNEKGGE